jgi:hypothetical protein
VGDVRSETTLPFVADHVKFLAGTAGKEKEEAPARETVAGTAPKRTSNSPMSRLHFHESVPLLGRHSRLPPWRSQYRSPSLSLAACACAPDAEDDDEEEDEDDASPTRGMAKAGGAPGGPVGAPGPEPLAPSMLGVRVGSREAGCFCVL